MSTYHPSTDNANLLVRMGRGWNQFWFTPLDPTLLGLIRICCGLITLYVYLAYTGDLVQFFGKDAWCDIHTMNEIRQNQPWPAQTKDWIPLQEKLHYAVRGAQAEPPTDAQIDYMQTWPFNPEQKDITVFRGYYGFSLWYHVGREGVNPAWLWVIHGATCFIIFLFVIGFCSRLTAVLTWLATVSYIHRAPTVLFGQDTMMNILLLYLMIGPSGAALSVDRLIRHWWEGRKARRQGKPEPAWTPPQPLVSANVAIRLIQINLCLIYGMSGMSKLHGTSWWNGTAIWLAQANFEFAPLWLAPYKAWLHFLCDHRLLWELVMSSSVLFTFAVEVGFPFLVWNRKLRPYMVAAAVLMHTGIALTMGLRTFSMMMMVMDIAFLPPHVARAFLLNLRERLSGLFAPTVEPEPMR